MNNNVNSCRVTLTDVENDIVRNTALAVQVDEIFELKGNSNYDPERYRLHVKVTDSDKTRSIRGLIDTGANNEALSLKACWDLGITDKIVNGTETVTLADKSKVTVGRVTTTLNIGDVPYHSTFLVLPEIDGYGMMVGTKFLQSNQLMGKVMTLMQDTLGADNVAQGN